MNQLAGGLARVSGGYELGLFGMEGRGAYAGVNAAGLHAGWSRNGGFSYGFEEQVYYGIGNNSNIAGADTYTTSVVRQELWLPTLGKLGHLTFGTSYDVSSKGIRKVQLEEIKALLENSSNPEDIAVVGRLKYFLENPDEIIDMKTFLRTGRALRRNGFEMIQRPGDHSDGFSKTTFRKTGSSEYGNIEFMTSVMNDNTYCSYNYGNNILTHFLIDYLGWKGRGY